MARLPLSLAAAISALALASTSGLADDPKDAPVVPPRKGTSETIPLFDGKDLKGWLGHDANWSVKDGVIVGKNTDPVKVSTYLQTERNFTDFRLTARVKLVESEMHSGIAFWGRTAPEHTATSSPMRGIWSCSPSGWGMYDLFGRNLLPVDPEPAKKVGKQHDWNDLEILAQGNRVRVAVNGVQVIDWARPPSPTGSSPGRSACNSTRTPWRRRSSFTDLKLETFPKEEQAPHGEVIGAGVPSSSAQSRSESSSGSSPRIG